MTTPFPFSWSMHPRSTPPAWPAVITMVTRALESSHDVRMKNQSSTELTLVLPRKQAARLSWPVPGPALRLALENGDSMLSARLSWPEYGALLPLAILLVLAVVFIESFPSLLLLLFPILAVLLYFDHLRVARRVRRAVETI
ncbi:MAG: hypothetical protein RBU27_14195 [Bacteroidota bacterium]|nr:hypothetical protein [Bacteroidota bacterium]